jgi:hypothetical protein
MQPAPAIPHVVGAMPGRQPASPAGARSGELARQAIKVVQEAQDRASVVLARVRKRRECEAQ